MELVDSWPEALVFDEHGNVILDTRMSAPEPDAVVRPPSSEPNNKK